MTESKILIISIIIFVITGLVAIFYKPHNQIEENNIDNLTKENDPITKMTVQEALQIIKKNKKK